MTTTVSVDDEWRMFLNSQSNGMDLSARMMINSQWSEPNPAISAVIKDAEYANVNTNTKTKTIKINPKKTIAAIAPLTKHDLSVVSMDTVLNADKLPTKRPNIVHKSAVVMDAMSSEDDEEDSSDEDSSDETETEPDEDTRGLSQKAFIPSVSVIEQDNELDGEEAMATNTLYISTKTKVLFLNQTMDLNTLFWSIPITEYWRPIECVVKKQMKIVSNTPEEYQELVEKLKKEAYYTEHVIKQIDNPNARRIKFKDERKITIGVSKKDIMNYRCKVKNAFYNCFAIIIRFKYQNAFKEIHVKVFNTGKLEIPGVLNKEILDIVSRKIIEVLQPFVSEPLGYVEETQEENVLINSNFNCGYYINREELFSILRAEPYGIETSYDPCIYPGIKCKFYFNNEIGIDKKRQTGNFAPEERNMKKQLLLDSKKYTEVSFMIFRTGSCLIVGNCPEKTLVFVFEYIRDILLEQCERIYVKRDNTPIKGKKPKQRKKNVSITSNYYSKIINTNV